jgi:hypothetical protein
MVIEALPAELVYRVRLNQSADGLATPRPGERRYPQDGGLDRARALRHCDESTAVAELWRDGLAPEWVNVSVLDETGSETVVELVCCGRFTADESRLYHEREGAPPFHVLGPVLPPQGHGERFSIHHRSECWDFADAARLAGVADRVRQLSLWTGELDTDALAPLPDLPALEVLEHRACALGADALSSFARFPRLRQLDLRLLNDTEFAVTGGGRCGALSALAVYGLPARPWGPDELGATCPALADLTLQADGVLWLDGPIPDGVDRLSIAAAGIEGPGRLPTRLESLVIHLPEGGDAAVLRLLDGVAELTSLTLRGTPLGGEVALALTRRFKLRFLDVVDTALTAPDLERLRAEHSDLRLLPRAPGLIAAGITTVS